MSDVAAVAFDLDGVLIESEQACDDARREVVSETLPGAAAAVSSPAREHAAGDTRRDPSDAR